MTLAQDPPAFLARGEQFEIVFRTAPMGLILVGLDGRMLLVNPAMCRIVGFTEAELLERTVQDITHPDDRALTQQWLLRMQREPEETLQLDKRYLHKDGHVVWAAVSVHMHRDSAGRPDFSVTHVQDITERKRAEAILRESEEKFRIAFENAPMGMTIIGSRGQFLAVNPAVCRMFGYSREELCAGTLNDITHPDDVERGNAWIRKMMSGDYSEPEFEKRYIHKDGHIVWGLVRAQWVRNDDGSPRMSVVHVLDITARKRAEEALLAREGQLREAHEIAQMGHWQLDVGSGTMVWADGIYRILELDPTVMSPTYELFMSRVHPDDLPKVTAALGASVDNRYECDVVHRVLLPDGRIKHVRRICRAEVGAGGKAPEVVGILQDVTMIRRAEEQRVQLEGQLHRAQKLEAVGYLAGGVAHDFNNLLTVIGGNASLALLDVAADSTTGELLTEVLKGVGTAAELTRQLLAFSRKQVIVPKVMNLNEAVTQASSMLRRLLGEDLDLVTMLEPKLGRVRLDPGQVEQILVNLAVNARDAMRDGGRLVIETANVTFDDVAPDEADHHLVGPHVMLAVSDNGCGMSDAIKQHIFEPFFTTKAPGRGTGLGLAMVYGAVKQSHGDIEVDSVPGRGTTFRLYLPQVDEPLPETESKPALEASKGRETILLVEDDASVRAVGERILSRQGYRVYACANGDEALATVNAIAEPIALVITDVVMPGMNGRVLSERLKAIRPGLRVLYTSGYTEDLVVDHGVVDGGIEFLAKPYSPTVLANRVRELLGA